MSKDANTEAGRKPVGPGRGVTVGAGAGMIFGAALGNPGIGLLLGAGIGLVLGQAITRDPSQSSSPPESGSA